MGLGSVIAFHVHDRSENDWTQNASYLCADVDNHDPGADRSENVDHGIGWCCCSADNNRSCDYGFDDIGSHGTDDNRHLFQDLDEVRHEMDDHLCADLDCNAEKERSEMLE